MAKDKKQQKTVGAKEAAFKLEDIADTPVAITVFPGSIEGDRVTYSVRGNDRAVLAYGTANEIAQYTIGNEVELKSKLIPAELQGSYKRNVSRKQADAVQRIKDEMNKGSFTLTVNNEQVSPDSILNGYFQKISFIEDEKGNPIMKPTADLVKADKEVIRDGKPVQTMGGVELVISSVIVPGYEPRYR